MFSRLDGVALAERRQPDLPEAPSIEVGSSRTELRPGGGSRVLVVEENAPLVQLLRQQRQAKSHDVSVVHDGEMAGQAIEGSQLEPRHSRLEPPSVGRALCVTALYR